MDLQFVFGNPKAKKKKIVAKSKKAATILRREGKTMPKYSHHKKKAKKNPSQVRYLKEGKLPKYGQAFPTGNELRAVRGALSETKPKWHKLIQEQKRRSGETHSDYLKRIRGLKAKKAAVKRAQKAAIAKMKQQKSAVKAAVQEREARKAEGWREAGYRTLAAAKKAAKKVRKTKRTKTKKVKKVKKVRKPVRRFKRKTGLTKGSVMARKKAKRSKKHTKKYAKHRKTAKRRKHASKKRKHVSKKRKHVSKKRKHVSKKRHHAKRKHTSRRRRTARRRTGRYLSKGKSIRFAAKIKGVKRPMRFSLKRLNPIGGAMDFVKKFETKVGIPIAELGGLAVGGALYGAVNRMILKVAFLKSAWSKALGLPYVGTIIVPALPNLLVGIAAAWYGRKKGVTMLTHAGQGLIGSAVVGIGVSASQTLFGKWLGVEATPVSGYEYLPGGRGSDFGVIPQGLGGADFGGVDFTMGNVKFLNERNSDFGVVPEGLGVVPEGLGDGQMG